MDEQKNVSKDDWLFNIHFSTYSNNFFFSFSFHLLTLFSPLTILSGIEIFIMIWKLSYTKFKGQIRLANTQWDCQMTLRCGPLLSEMNGYSLADVFINRRCVVFVSNFWWKVDMGW